MRRLSRVVATVTAVAAIGASSACGGDNPTPSTAPSAKPSSAASNTEKPPKAAEGVSTKNKAGAVAAIQFFLKSMEFAGSRGDVSQFRASFAPSCTKCEAIAAGIERTYAAGGSIKGGGWRARSFKVYGIQNNVAIIDVTVDYAKQTFQASTDAAVDRVPAQRNVLKAFQVTWDGRWRIGALDPEA